MPAVGFKDSAAAANRPIPNSGVDVNLASDFDITSALVSGYARELYVGTGGTVIAVMRGDGNAHTYKNVQSGASLSGEFITVRSTANGTTAADIVARY